MYHSTRPEIVGFKASVKVFVSGVFVSWFDKRGDSQGLTNI
jgi:hypothetical protein